MAMAYESLAMMPAEMEATTVPMVRPRLIQPEMAPASVSMSQSTLRPLMALSASAMPMLREIMQIM